MSPSSSKAPCRWMTDPPNFLSSSAIPALQHGRKHWPSIPRKQHHLHTFAPAAKWDDVALAFKNGFGSALHETFVEGELTPSEWELARQLAAEKYSKLIWQKERITLVQ